MCHLPPPVVHVHVSQPAHLSIPKVLGGPHTWGSKKNSTAGTVARRIHGWEAVGSDRMDIEEFTERFEEAAASLPAALRPELLRVFDASDVSHSAFIPRDNRKQGETREGVEQGKPTSTGLYGQSPQG